MKITVDEFCEVTGVERTVGYGFLRWLSESGHVETTRGKRPGQTRGKPTNFYNFGDASLPDKLKNALEDMIDKIAASKQDEVDSEPATLEPSTEPEEAVVEEAVEEEEVAEFRNERVGERDEEDEELTDEGREYLVS